MAQPSTYPRSPSRRNPSARWYLLVVALAVIGITIGAVLAWRAVAAFPSVVAEARANQQLEVSLDDEGLAIFADSGSARLDCSATDAQGASVPLERLTASETITVGSRTWHVVLRSPEPTPPGTYTVLCASEDTSTVYGVGPRASVFGFVGLVLGAVAALGVGIFGGFLLWLVIFLLRRRTPPGQVAAPGYPPA
ncbi:hypothetical protein [Lolliginicoccus suaedae]|uniref:hypothetical protein n=1 Tax=Lolliginicoccus suaedae TaxID=2605429 RepID=UPI0011EBB64B|nr:hypothetical protein [Lolliginicoccus suaedae]